MLFGLESEIETERELEKRTGIKEMFDSPWHSSLAKKIVGLVLTIIIVIALIPCSRALAISLGESYTIMQRDYPEMIGRLIAGGATETDIKLFLTDLEEHVSQKGTLTEDNFDSHMYHSFEDVITQRKHRTLFKVMLDEFGEEIDYTLENRQLHPDLIPVRNAVKEAVFGRIGMGTSNQILHKVASIVRKGELLEITPNSPGRIVLVGMRKVEGACADRDWLIKITIDVK